MGYVFDAMQNSSEGEDANDALVGNILGKNVEESANDDSASGEPVKLADGNDPLVPPAVDALGRTPSPQHEAPGKLVECKLDERLVTALAPESGRAESYRRLASRLIASAGGKQGVHAITSAARKEGKTLTCANLAIAMGELADQRTVLVEGDLRAADLMRLIRLEKMPAGLFQLLDGTAEVDDVIIRPEGCKAAIIFAGCRGDGRAPSLLNSRRLPEIIAQLRQRFDQIIIDTPPILDVSDTGALCGVADQVAIAVRMNQTHRQLVHDAVSTIRSYNPNLAGVVLTDVKAHAIPYGRRYLNGYYYGYGAKTSGRNAEAASVAEAA